MSRIQVISLTTRHLGPIDFSMDAGECTTLSGPSGAGKTLLLRAMADLDPHNGEIYLEASEQRTFTPAVWRRKVGFLPAESHWWCDLVRDHVTPTRNFMKGLESLGLPKEILEWPVGRLSSGERQRMALLRLLGNNPEVLLLDEPTANLDPDSVQRVERLIVAYRRDHGASILWVTHDEEQRLRMGSRSFLLKNQSMQEVSV